MFLRFGVHRLSGGGVAQRYGFGGDGEVTVNISNTFTRNVDRYSTQLIWLTRSKYILVKALLIPNLYS